jgi:X-Pro dipeptidyl-peptidase
MKSATPLLCALAALAAAVATTPVAAQEFVDGLAQPVFAGQSTIRHNVWVEIPDLDTDRDGVNDRIRVQINRPAATEDGTRLAIVLTASPYSGGTRPWVSYDITGPLYVPESNHNSHGHPQQDHDDSAVNPPYYGNEPPFPNIGTSSYQSYFLPRGFIFAYAQSLGTGLSTGCATIGGIEESLAMKAVIDWFNGRGNGYDEAGEPVDAYWTTGATTMIGVSYDGTLPIAAASTGVEGLKAIVPIAGVSSYYDHRRSYGGVINSYPSIGTDADTLFDNILTRRYPEYCHYMKARLQEGMDRLTGDYNDWWDERNYRNYVRDFRSAVFISHGLNDFNVKPRHFARLWEQLKKHHVPAKMWLNQGGHGDGANTFSRREAWREELNRFWSHHLYGVDNAAMDGPRVVVQRENGQWVEYSDWPITDAKGATFNLVASGDNSIGSLRVEDEHGNNHVFETIIDDSSIDSAVLAAALQSPHRLVYQSDPLMNPVHVSGVPAVSLRVSFSEPAAIVSAMLVDYRDDGSTAIVTRGWADPQNRQSIWKTSPVKTGKSYKIDFELQPHDYIFEPGSRIGFVLLSSERLFTLRPPPGTELTVNSGKSTFTLPVVGGYEALSLASLR